MKWLLVPLLFVVSLFTHKKSSQEKDDDSIKKVEITRGFFIITTEKITLRRGTEVYVTKIKGRCIVRGFTTGGAVLVELPDKTVMPFNKNRISLAPLHK